MKTLHSCKRLNLINESFSSNNDSNSNILAKIYKLNDNEDDPNFQNWWGIDKWGATISGETQEDITMKVLREFNIDVDNVDLIKVPDRSYSEVYEIVQLH